jgi:hypothetical protein
MLRRKEAEEKKIMFRKEKEIKATPVLENDIDRVLNAQEKAEQKFKSTYVDRRLEEAKAILQEKQKIMMQMQKETQAILNEVTLLQKLKDTNAGMYVMDVLDIIDEYRTKDFTDQKDMLDTMEKDIIQITLEDLKAQAR